MIYIIKYMYDHNYIVIKSTHERDKKDIKKKTWMFLWHTLSNKANVRGYPQSPGNLLYWSLSHYEVFLACLAISQATKTSTLRTVKPAKYYFNHNNQFFMNIFNSLTKNTEVSLEFMCIDFRGFSDKSQFQVKCL